MDRERHVSLIEMEIKEMVRSLIHRYRQFESLAESISSYGRSPLLLILRLYWGYDFFQTGLGKLNNLEGVTEFFTSLNIPFPYYNALFVGSVELVGGLLLMAGLFSRFIAIPLIINMCVAYATDDREALMNIFSDPDGFVTATPFLHLLTTTVILFFGPGIFSFDRLLNLSGEGPKKNI